MGWWGDGMRDAPLENCNPVLAAHAMRNLRREALVVHQQELELTNVVHQELLQSVGQKVASLLVRAVPNLSHDSYRFSNPLAGGEEKRTHLGHRQLALEPPAHPVIDTLRLPPCLPYRVVAVRLVAPAEECLVLGRSNDREVHT